MKEHSRDPDPIFVSQPEAMRLLGIKSTKFHELKKAKVFETVELGGRPMVRYESLKRLAEPKQAA